MGRRRNRPVNPDAVRALDNLKYEVAQELGYVRGGSEDELRANLDRMKYEIADELGLSEKIRAVGWPNMTSRECGRIGGQLGGRLGGQMVKRMIEYAEARMAQDQLRR
ncbi:MAG TPA: alpha/beta-type small acid-soluble spore protein [Firmicutes bacterium]|nr:alpha/beta-type small acid-soluble spore protein [Candidatus Fermentithermobacillaceae bacterium]